MKALLDFIPLIAFFLASKQYGILAGAGALLIATLVVYVLHLIKQKGKLDKQQWVTLILTIFFCGLTLLLKDDIFLKWKSTVINGVFAVALVGSVLIKRPLLQLAMKSIYTLSASGWNKLTLVWAVYFVLMAFLQYYFAFYTSEQTWINFKTYGWIPFMLVFMIGQFVALKNHLNPDLVEKGKE
ncbi:septation protein IspZ [Psychrobacter sp. I-STPA6b]|uniref:septation protein IspZ n=1 Tax=Psychrobacter sp. I-STPA6b TaxID=2585718 RepID=UPI001D0C9D38|nr:septation protein IspZ [Psychrobacter sp. I-STPA6b]